MSLKILVAYATMYGSTGEVAEAIGDSLRQCGFEVQVLSAREVRDLQGFAAVVLGAPLIMFHWHKDALKFLARHRPTLEGRPVALFALGPVTDPPTEKEWNEAHSQWKKDLSDYSWLSPVAQEVFGGRFDPALLRFPMNKLAGKAPASDLRDWDAIHTWANSLAGKIA